MAASRDHLWLPKAPIALQRPNLRVAKMRRGEFKRPGRYQHRQPFAWAKWERSRTCGSIGTRITAAICEAPRPAV